MFKKLLLNSAIILALDSAAKGPIALVSDEIRNPSSVDAGNTVTVTITRAGTFTDPRYGTFTLSNEMFDQMIENFNKNVFGQKIALDVAHNPNNGAAGYFTRLFRDNNKLRGEVTLTAYGIDAIKNKGHIYLSAEIHPDFEDNETQEKHGSVLLGAGLVVRPCIKRLDPVELSEDVGFEAILLSERLRKRLESEDLKMKFAELLKALKTKFAELKLNQEVSDNLYLSAEKSLEKVEDEATAKIILSGIEQAAEKLVGASGVGDISISLGQSGMTEAQVLALLESQTQAAAQQAKEKKEKLDAKIKLFDDQIDGAEGISDNIKTKLKENGKSMINENISDESIKQFALNQIALGNELQLAENLKGVGFSSGPTGTMAFKDDPDSDSIKLENKIHGALKLTSAYQSGELKLTEFGKLSVFVKSVLQLFDQQNAKAIKTSVLALAGETSIADTDLPVAFQREVIRESLSDLNILQLVNTMTDPKMGATTQIPYEERNVGAVVNDAITFERQGIKKAGVRQRMTLAYMNAMKIAIDVSDEVIHLSQASGLNWDAWGRNVATAARLMRELLARRVANEMQRVSDSFGAVANTDEDIAAQLDGATPFIKTSAFPIVRPFQQYDMEGNTIGAEENPISISFGATPISAFDGSGTQAAGTYYRVINFNLGYIQFVDETGVLVMPNEGAATISYSEATNVVKVDSDVPNGVEPDKHLNKLLKAVGARKAFLSSTYFVKPDFLLMSDTLNDECTNAEQFAASNKRDGTNTNLQGDLVAVKGLPVFGTNAPNIDLGDERILMGVSGTMSYVVGKPWTMSEVIQGRDANGDLNGTKEAYGQEFNCIKCPAPVKNRFTSVLYYSVGSR